MPSTASPLTDHASFLVPALGFRRSGPPAVVATSAVDLAFRAREAQRQFDGWPEERVDALLLDIAETISAASPALAAEAVAETGIGNVADKITKTRFASLLRPEKVSPAFARCRVDTRCASRSLGQTQDLGRRSGPKDFFRGK